MILKIKFFSLIFFSLIVLISILIDLVAFLFSLLNLFWSNSNWIEFRRLSYFFNDPRLAKISSFTHAYINSSKSDFVFSKEEIEKLNILNASLLAMKRAIKKLKKKPRLVLVDGNRIPVMKNYNLKYVIKGDRKIPQISAASIVAKVSRDSLMKKISKNFSKYQWNKNCGYGTKVHIQAIRKFGITKHHRRTFKPIHNILSPR